jgi:hypothetical protein
MGDRSDVDNAVGRVVGLLARCERDAERGELGVGLVLLGWDDSNQSKCERLSSIVLELRPSSDCRRAYINNLLECNESSSDRRSEEWHQGDQAVLADELHKDVGQRYRYKSCQLLTVFRSAW